MAHAHAHTNIYTSALWFLRPSWFPVVYIYRNPWVHRLPMSGETNQRVSTMMPLSKTGGNQIWTCMNFKWASQQPEKTPLMTKGNGNWKNGRYMPRYQHKHEVMKFVPHAHGNLLWNHCWRTYILQPTALRTSGAGFLDSTLSVN